MKHYVDAGDFERYVIPLPADARFGKKKKSYIRTQLEKRHPCFSDSCCFDVCYGFFGKELTANAVVMDKVVLSRYRLQYPGKTLTAKVDTRDRRVFRQRSLVVPAVITPVVLSALIFSVFQPPQKTIPDVAPVSVIVQETPAVFEPQVSALLSELFMAITEADGKCMISRFEFSRQNGSESILMDISGIYPESLQQIETYPVSFSPVTYHEGTPAFSLSFVSKYDEPKLRTSTALATDIIPGLRKIITESGGTMIQESAGQGEVKFHAPSTNFKPLMHALEELRSKSNLAVQNFSLNSRGGNQNNEFEGLISVTIDKNSGNFSFNPLVEYSGLFFTHLRKPQISQMSNPTKKENGSIPVSYSKIGEIQEGGKKCIFYRTAEGKIVRIEE
jgi:hypothetical protein